MTLKEARLNARYTQKEAARLLGVSVPTLWNWENGTSEPNVTAFRKMCELYQVKSDAIFMP